MAVTLYNWLYWWTVTGPLWLSSSSGCKTVLCVFVAFFLLIVEVMTLPLPYIHSATICALSRYIQPIFNESFRPRHTFCSIFEVSQCHQNRLAVSRSVVLIREVVFNPLKGRDVNLSPWEEGWVSLYNLNMYTWPSYELVWVIINMQAVWL